MAKEKLFLIDGHALCYRCFFAIRDLTTSKGQPTNAVYGFIRIIRNILREYQPDYMAVCFDTPKKTHRQEKFAEYKIQRPSMPDDLRSQIPVIKDVIKAFNVAIFEKDGYEADDLIATISKKFAQKGREIVIVSDDKDMYQLAAGNIKYFNSKSGTILGTKELKEKLGFAPQRIADFIGLAGDVSDNIPGVAGIGAVGARQLINEFGDLEAILKHFEKIKEPKGKEKLLVEQREAAIFSKELAILDQEVPIDYDVKELKVQAPDHEQLHAIFQDLEFQKLADEFSVQKPVEKINVRSVSKPADLKAFIAHVEKKGKFTFLIEGSEQDALFASGTVFVTTEGGPIHSLAINDISELKPIFENKNILKITYNVKGMLKVLTRQEILVGGKAFDVMLAGYLLGGSQLSFELNSLTWTYLKSSITEEQGVAGQIQAVQQLYAPLLKEIKNRSLMELFDDIEMPLAHVLFEVEENGVNLDLMLLKKLSKDCAKKIGHLTTALYKIAGEEFNLNSPKQLSHILFEKLDLPVIKKTKTGFSTNEAVLTILADQHELPALILEYRQLAKLKSTYIDALPKLVNERTGRVHAQFNQTGAETGRLSSSNPNLQNIPVRTELGRQIRKAFIPSEKSLMMIAADYSQIELRILAHLSGDKNLIKAFKEGEDIHSFTASLIFDIKEKDVTDDMRNSAKRVNFGIIYGISAFGLANDLKVTQPEAQEFIDKYFHRYPAVKKFMDNEIKKCEKNGYVTTLLNRRRYIPEINSKNGAMKQFAQRQAINTPVQGSAADLIKLAMINIQREIKEQKLKTKMISTVHDELIFESPPKEKTTVVDLIRDKMMHAVTLVVPIEVNVKVGKNWLEMEEV